MTQATPVSWNRLRKIIQKRDNSICFYCGKKADNGQCDHLIPLSRGGTDSVLNLVWSCGMCNGKKGNKLVMALMASTHNVSVMEEIKEDEPKFDRIIPDLIKAITLKLVPPYPRYKKEENWTAYFIHIEFITINCPILTWLAHRIWGTPSEVKAIQESLEDLNDLKFRVGNKPKDFDIKSFDCPLCNTKLSFEDTNKKYLFNWVCEESGHVGTVTDIFAEGFLEDMRLVAIKQAGIKALG